MTPNGRNHLWLSLACILVIIMSILPDSSCLFQSPPAPRPAYGLTGDGTQGVVLSLLEKGRFSLQRIGADGTALWHNKEIAFPLSADVPYVQPVADGAGGFFVPWYSSREAGKRVQRLGPDGKPLWGDDGIAIQGEELASDGFGGAFLSSGDDGWMLKRLDGSGAILWDDVDVGIMDPVDLMLKADGDGGMFAIWTDKHMGALHVQRLDAQGLPAWADHAMIMRDDAMFQGIQPRLFCGVTDDGAGGIILAWADSRGNASDIYLQRIDVAGNVVWPENMIVTKAEGDLNDLAVGCPVADGSGGVIMAWSERRGTQRGLYGQRLDGSGHTLWADGGVLFMPSWPAGISGEGQIVGDGSGGAIAVWQVGQTLSICVQRIDPEGNPLWRDDFPAEDNPTAREGVYVFGDASRLDSRPLAISDAKGGVIVACGRGDTIQMQRLDADGKRLWGGGVEAKS